LKKSYILLERRNRINNHPKVCIIILNWNGLEDTIECLESLKKISYPNYEVIVVDNGSEGEDAQVLKEKFGDYIYLIRNDKNYGSTGGNNIGMRYALDNSNADYLLLLNNDTIVDAQFITEMLKVAETDPTIGIAGARVYYYDDPDRLQPAGVKISLWTAQTKGLVEAPMQRTKRTEVDGGQYDPVREVDWVTGCCFLIKKRVVENIGFFDESFFCYWDEPDYCLRAKKAGYKIVYVPRAKLWHKVGAATKKVTGFGHYYGARNSFLFMRKHATRWQYRCFLIYFFGVYFWRVTAGCFMHRRHPRMLFSFYQGIRDGLRHPRTGEGGVI